MFIAVVLSWEVVSQQSLYINGVHIHHFIWGFVSIVWALGSFVVSKVSFSITFKSPVTPATYTVSFVDQIFPYASFLIYLAIGLALIISDWSDFVGIVVLGNQSWYECLALPILLWLSGANFLRIECTISC
jgi:hypothetical protein